MKCRHKYVHPRWKACAPKMRHIVTFECDECGALGVRSLGETPDQVGVELCVAQTMELFGPAYSPYDFGSDDEVEWSGDGEAEWIDDDPPSIERLAVAVAAVAVGGKPDRLEMNPDNIEAAIMAGMDVEVVPVDDTQESD